MIMEHHVGVAPLSSSKAAFSLVELLVVMLIVAIFSLFAGPVMVRASRLERNLRDEAYVRTRLVLDMERIAREVSLASRIDWLNPENGDVAATSQDAASLLNLDFPATNYIVQLFYPEETGGVSFETNRISQVSSVRLFPGTDFVLASASNRVDLMPAEQRRRLAVDPVFVGTKNPVRLTGLSMTNVISGAEVQADLLHVTISAMIDLDAGNGKRTPKEISVDRLMRMWNK